jgi:hypothetical protein
LANVLIGFGLTRIEFVKDHVVFITDLARQQGHQSRQGHQLWVR